MVWLLLASPFSPCVLHPCFCGTGPEAHAHARTLFARQPPVLGSGGRTRRPYAAAVRGGRARGVCAPLGHRSVLCPRVVCMVAAGGGDNSRVPLHPAPLPADATSRPCPRRELVNTGGPGPFNPALFSKRGSQQPTTQRAAPHVRRPPEIFPCPMAAQPTNQPHSHPDIRPPHTRNSAFPLHPHPTHTEYYDYTMVSAKSVLFVLLAMLVAATALRRESRGQLSQLSSSASSSHAIMGMVGRLGGTSGEPTHAEMEKHKKEKFEKFYQIHKRGPKPNKNANRACMIESTERFTHGINTPWLKCCNLGNHWGKSLYCKDDENPEASSQ